MASSTSDTTPPIDPPTTEELWKNSIMMKTLSIQKSGKKTPAEPAETVVDPLQVPLPQEWTTTELIAQRREEKGPFFACAFACCCCFLCYKRLEFVLDFVCCTICK